MRWSARRPWRSDGLRREYLEADELQHAALDRSENGMAQAGARPPVVSESIARLPLKTPLALFLSPP
jgi:hypothetical protein